MKLSYIKKVYVAEYNGCFKIGVIDNVPLRMKQLSCGCPTIKAIYESKYISNPFEVEIVLHDLYKNKRIGGEWFSEINLKEISKVVQKIGIDVDYEKCKKEEKERISNCVKNISKMFFYDSEFLTEKINGTSGIEPYIDFDEGWKFTENDLEFLLLFYKDWVSFLKEECDEDFIDDKEQIIKALNEKGVNKSKDLIQESAYELSEVVNHDIYHYYKDDGIIRLIECSILNNHERLVE